MIRGGLAGNPSKNQAVCAGEPPDSIGAVHAARDFTTCKKSWYARLGMSVDADTAVCRMRVHRNAQLVVGGDSKFVFHPLRKRLHELRRLVFGKVVVDGDSVCSRGVDCHVDEFITETARERSVS